MCTLWLTGLLHALSLPSVLCYLIPAPRPRDTAQVKPLEDRLLFLIQDFLFKNAFNNCAFYCKWKRSKYIQPFFLDKLSLRMSVVFCDMKQSFQLACSEDSHCSGHCTSLCRSTGFSNRWLRSEWRGMLWAIKTISSLMILSGPTCGTLWVQEAEQP